MATTAYRRPDSFAQRYEALTGFAPYRWQASLYSSFVAGRFEDVKNVALPTGAGKTSLMPIWLLALAEAVAECSPSAIRIPRRLVWVVDRRVVVDQATAEAEAIARKLCDPNPALVDVTAALRRLCASDPEGSPLAISTLRGEKEDNRAWSKDPSRAAIIVGTVDMIGSRLLCSGYGDSKYMRPQHAALIGHDTLLVNDEAHLTPAFAELIDSIERRQRGSLKPFVTMRLSATHSATKCWPQSLEEDAADHAFSEVFKAPKSLTIEDATVKGKLLKLAIGDAPARTIIFVRLPEDAREIADMIAAKVGSERVATLTGTMRGFERDELVRSNHVFKFFQQKDRPEESYWIVATSAAEVGANISADRLITDCDTLEHLLQRFGRLNRFGGTNGEAYLLVRDADFKKNGDCKKAALEFLRSLPVKADNSYDISTATLFGRELPPDACTEVPLLAPLHDWHIDLWSQTTLGDHPARPPVESWLHGKQDEDWPETYVAWREDVLDLADSSVENSERETVLDKYRVLAHERLREPTSRLLKKLKALHDSANETQRSQRLLMQDKDGRVRSLTLAKLARLSQRELAYAQLVLAPGVGTLQNGMFSEEWPDAAKSDATPYDVSGQAPGVKLERSAFRATREEDGWSLKPLGAAKAPDAEPQLPDLSDSNLGEFATRRDLQLLYSTDIASDAEEHAEPRAVLLYFRRAKGQQTKAPRVTLEDHTARVRHWARRLAKALALPAPIPDAFTLAGEWHDLGKAEPTWQRWAGNDDIAKPVAKPMKRNSPKLLGGFRHELASLAMASSRQDFGEVVDEVRDLALHLVAAHHGSARPCFVAKAYSRECGKVTSERVALEATQRFARLQRHYGAWGLAYLEAVFKAADGLASNEEQHPNE